MKNVIIRNLTKEDNKAIASLMKLTEQKTASKAIMFAVRHFKEILEESKENYNKYIKVCDQYSDLGDKVSEFKQAFQNLTE